MRLSLRSRLFLLFLSVFGLSLVGAWLYLVPHLERMLTDRIERELSVKLFLIQRDVSGQSWLTRDREKWKPLVDDLGRRAQVRVTLIDPDGNVFADSDVVVSDLGRVENHAGRPEVMAALAKGEGTDLRMSSTVKKRMLYGAVPFGPDDRPTGVVRLAIPLTEVDEVMDRMHGNLRYGGLFAFVMAFFLAAGSTHLVSRRVIQLTEVASRMAAGDLTARTRMKGRDEIANLGMTLDRLAEGLTRTMNDFTREKTLFEGVLKGMQEGVLLLDREHRIILANPALRSILMLTPDSVGRSIFEAARHAELYELIHRLDDAEAPLMEELELGGLKPRRVLVQASKLSEAPEGYLAVFMDITDLSRLESLRQDFVANVSHELRTPITVIQTATETVQSLMQKEPSKAAQFLDMIGRNTKRLHQLVEDLLDLSRIESREYELHLEKVDVSDVTSEVASQFASHAEKKGIALRWEIPSSRYVVHADRRALEQILSNLIDNAIKYCPGECTVAVVCLEAEGSKNISIVVEDNGPGIEERHLARLFERFYRVDAGRSREAGGTGLGLSIVKHLAQSMGGTVTVESTVGVGSRFILHLPSA